MIPACSYKSWLLCCWKIPIVTADTIPFMTISIKAEPTGNCFPVTPLFRTEYSIQCDEQILYTLRQKCSWNSTAKCVFNSSIVLISNVTCALRRLKQVAIDFSSSAVARFPTEKQPYRHYILSHPSVLKLSHTHKYIVWAWYKSVKIYLWRNLTVIFYERFIVLVVQHWISILYWLTILDDCGYVGKF